MNHTGHLLNYSKLEGIAKDNQQFLKEITESYIQLLTDFRKDYGQIVLGNDPKAFQEATHKLKGSLRFLEAQPLLYEIAKFRSEFYAGNHSTRSSLASVKQVNSVCDGMLEILDLKMVRFR